MANVSFLPRDEDAPPSDPTAAPQVFPRTFTTPPGPPWEQGRAAALEARHGAPLPLAEVAYRLRRLGRWAPGKAGRYAAFYVRTREFTARFTAVVEVDGRPFEVEFRPEADRKAQVRTVTVGLAIGIATLAMAGGGLFAAQQARVAAEERLSTAELAAAAKLKLGRTLQRQRDAERRLQAAQGSAEPLDNVLADLTWASASRAPEAWLAAAHWDHGLLAVEVRGSVPPFQQTQPGTLRSGGQVRPGVFLWALKPPRTGFSTQAAPPAEETAP